LDDLVTQIAGHRWIERVSGFGPRQNESVTHGRADFEAFSKAFGLRFDPRLRSKSILPSRFCQVDFAKLILQRVPRAVADGGQPLPGFPDRSARPCRSA
jgi:hypothetical protein